MRTFKLTALSALTASLLCIFLYSPSAEAAEKELTPRQELLKRLPKDTKEMVVIGEDTVAIWSITTTSGAPLEMIEAAMVTENGTIETTVWSIGNRMRSILMIATTNEGAIPQLVADFHDGDIKVNWQLKPFSPEELENIRQYAQELVRITLTTIGTSSDSALKKYIEKDRI